MKNGDLISSDEPKKPKCMKLRTILRKKSTYCVLGFVVSITLAVLIYFLTTRDRIPTCSTLKCQTLAEEILGYVDENANPCNDFYQFACGSFLRVANLTSGTKSFKQNMQEKIEADIRDMLEEPLNPDDLYSMNLARKFYKACTKTNAIEDRGLEKIKQILEYLGGWPAVEGEDWVEDRFRWIETVGALRDRGIKFNFFFDITVEVERDHYNGYIVGIHDKSFGSSTISPNNRNDYLNYMTNVAEQFKDRYSVVRRDLTHTLDFTLRLAAAAEESRKNDTYSYTLFTIQELQYTYRSIPWYKFLKSVIGEAASLTNKDVVAVYNTAYLEKLERLLRRTSKRTAANFMAWQIIQHLINFMPSSVLDKAYDYLDKVNGRLERSPRWQVCVQATHQKMSPTVNLGYIERFFDDDTRVHAIRLIRHVKEQFRRNMLALDWLDKETKDRVLSTLLASLEKIFMVHDLEEIIEEDKLYYTVNINEDDLVQAALDLDVIRWNLYFERLNFKTISDDWVRHPEFLTGFGIKYFPAENVMKFPLGMFTGIYYDRHRPEYMNYGQLGSILAHQISHIFVDAEDDEHQKRLINWWTTPSLGEYSKKLTCLANQYRGFGLYELENHRLNTYQTRDEDIADLAGVKIAYETYTRLGFRDPTLKGLKYTPRQLFWIASALQYCSSYPVGYFRNRFTQNTYRHSPNQFRVNGPLQNLQQFSLDFDCEMGTFMNPMQKCHVW